VGTTGNSLDVSITGRGFFQVLMPDGTFGYTRDGSFKMSSTGELVTSSGYKVQPGIVIPPNAQSITIGNDGVVSALSAGATAPTTVGTLQLTEFVNPAGLQPRGENLLSETTASGPAQTGNPGISGLGTLQQGSLEGSNVNVVEELVTMIETQRAYEMNSKAINTTDQMLQYASQNL
jgi:flagellar basal-body rod protein FlgG